MPAVSDTSFFIDLPLHRGEIGRLFTEEHFFQAPPPDWHVIVTDLKNSTRAHAQGRHEEINLIAAGCIIAALNLARHAGHSIPFFFGGDGATLIVPRQLRQPVLDALFVHQKQTMDSFGLDLRVGAVSVAGLYEAGHELRIARAAVTDRFVIPVLLGDGLSAAERMIKKRDSQTDASDTQAPADARLDLSGMECRWDRIEPIHAEQEVVCLIVVAARITEQAAVYREVIEHLDAIYGVPAARNPVATSHLRLDPTLRKISLETRVRKGRRDPAYLAATWAVTQGSRILFLAQEAGKKYIRDLIDQTDTLVIDGRINTVIAGTAAQRATLEKQLGALEAAGRLHFGLFVCRESVMSCYVTDRTERHIHFVDGTGGGYTRAAALLKQKLNPPDGAG